MTNKYSDRLHHGDAVADLFNDILLDQALQEGIDDTDEPKFEAWYDENWKQLLEAYLAELLPNLHMAVTFKPRDVEANEEQVINLLWIPRT